MTTTAFTSQAQYDQYVDNGSVLDPEVDGASPSGSNTTTIVLATVLPLLALALVGSAAVAYRRRQHSSTGATSVGGPETAVSKDNPLSTPDGASHRVSQPGEPGISVTKNAPTHPRTLSQAKTEDVSTI